MARVEHDRPLAIETLKCRVDALNQLRIERSLNGSHFAFQRVFNLLPSLFHYHHPALPGYITRDNMPCGIAQFSANRYQQRHLAGYLSVCGLTTADLAMATKPQYPAIIGLYSMGSTSSIAQNSHSDLDIWLCHQPWLDSQEREYLQQKCQAIQRWAASLSVQVSFFLVDENRFCDQQQHWVDGEDCGSTQRILLLDEFYRSAVRLAGRRILWNIIPVEHEAHYADYVLSLYRSGCLQADEWVDFGGLDPLSAEEYFGASLWQLYKSVDSPYKAVLKSVLLESYSWEYPQGQLLACEFKQYLHQGKIIEFGLDSYCLMLSRVSRYLLAIGDYARLDLIRRCFYLKISEKAPSEPVPKPHYLMSMHCRYTSIRYHDTAKWRQIITEKLVKKWGWNTHKISELNQRHQWKIRTVRSAHNELLAALMHSYRNLLSFARRHGIRSNADPHDIAVLTRKLYAAFEVLPGKITLVNPQISPDLAEQALTFVYVPVGRANPMGWYLYNRQPKFEQMVSQKPLEHHYYLIKLVAWAYFNGLLTEGSQLYLKGTPTCHYAKLTQLATDLARYFPLKVAAPTPTALSNPCEIRHLMVILNLEHDPTQTLPIDWQSAQVTDQDVLSFAAEQRCLVGSVDLLYRNSWNEVRTLHFNDGQAILSALKTILGKMHQGAKPPESVQVCSYSAHLAPLLSQRIENLLQECINLRLSARHYDQGRFKALKIAGQTWGIFFERLQVSVHKQENAVEFYGAISHNKLSHLTDQSKTRQLPNVIDGYASEGIIQFFFAGSQQNNTFTLYILDEHNGVEVYPHCQGSKERLVRDINRFYSAADDRFTLNTGSVTFNMPQFYQIIQQEDQLHVLPFYHHPEKLPMAQMLATEGTHLSSAKAN